MHFIEILQYRKTEMEGRWCVVPNPGGERCVAILPANRGRVRLLDENGAELELEPIRAKLQEINDTRNIVQSLVLEGQLVGFFEDRINDRTLQLALSGDKVGVQRTKFLAFDLTSEVDRQNPKVSYRNRWTAAQNLVTESLRDTPGTISRLGMVDMFECDNPTQEQIWRHCDWFAQKGYRGAMYRRALEPVVAGSWVEVAPLISVADVIGARSGSGKMINSLGVLLCQKEDGSPLELESGFEPQQRKAYWKLFSSGKLPARVKYKTFGDSTSPIFSEFI